MQTKSKRKIGYFTAGGVAIGQGLEGVLFQFFFLFFSVSMVQNNAFGTAVMAIKETIGIIISVTVFGPALFKSVLMRVKEKQAWYYIAASVFGTSIGNIFYIFAVAQAGSSYGVILSALYPIFSMLIIKFALKEKEPWKVWAGVCLTVMSGILFLFLPTAFSSEDGFTGKRFIGMILGLVAAFFWALEGVLLKAGMNVKGKNGEVRFTNNEIVATRSIFSGLSTYILLMPIMMVFGNSFSFYADVLRNWKAFLVVSAVAINIIILRMMHVFALSTIGPKITATIDTNNFLVPTLFAEILQFLDLHDKNGGLLFEPVIWWSYLLIIPLAIGVGMVVYFSDEPNPEVTYDKHLE